MTAPRLVSLLGLGFGDCGKGLFTDALCRRWPVHTVVRFNGGAQAGHSVVLPDGRHHTFSQFSSGSFVPGVATVLAYPVAIHPSALLIEATRLENLGIRDAFLRLRIDRRCRVTTPFHQAAGRLRELLRGDGAHGTCGVGVGETVRHALEHPEDTLCYGDLMRPALVWQKLDAIRRDMLQEFSESVQKTEKQATPSVLAEYRLLDDRHAAESWLISAIDLAKRTPPASPESIAEQLQRPGTVLFEGAQGVLLDEWLGFHPHTTWSRIHPDAVTNVAARYGLHSRIEHLGVLRAYPTRHGPGPLPTHDRNLDKLPEPHNSGAGWQGEFRRGQPDSVLLRYALSATGPLDGLLVSHLDVFNHADGLCWCESYQSLAMDRIPSSCYTTDPFGRIREIKPSACPDLDYQAGLTQLLMQARPHYDADRITSSQELLERITVLSNSKVWLGSFGPEFSAVRAFHPI